MTEFKIVPFSLLDREQKKRAVSLTLRYPQRKTVFKGTKSFSSPEKMVFVMLKDSEPFGIVSASIGLWHKKKCLTISDIYTRPSVEFYRANKKTIGEALVEKTIGVAIMNGCTILRAFKPNRFSKALIKRYIKKGKIEPVKSRALFNKPYRIKRI